MGIFDKKPKNDQQRLEELKGKYQPALRVMEQQQVRLQNVQMKDGKLLVQGVAPSQEAKNKVWDQIKLIDAAYQDLTADIVVEAGAPGRPAASAPRPGEHQIYTVQRGDTLSKISKQFYGDANAYMRIFNANRDKLTDPDKIQIGQKLVIPPAHS